MFCENCGKQNPDGARFCEHCGTPIEAEVAPVAPAAPAPTAAPVPVAPTKKITVAGLIEKAKAIHQKNKLIFPIAGAVVVVAIALVILFSILGKQVSMKNYVDITMEGYDGYGRISYQFGDVSFGMRAAGDKDCKEFGDEDDDESFLSYDKSDVSKDYRKNLSKAQKLVSSIEISYELPEGKTNDTLKNGDVITFTIEVNEKVAEDLGLTIKDTTFEYTVEGLKPVTQFDVLSYFELKAEGYDGYGNVTLVCNQNGTKQVGDITFEMTEDDTRIRYSHKDGYSGSIWVSLDGETYRKCNGDIMKAVVETTADYFISDGVELVGIEKEYTVSGLQETTAVDMLEYYKVEFTGLNGSGRVTATPKQDKVTIGDYTVDLTNGKWTKGEDSIGYTNVYFNDSYGLSNDDEIEFYVSFSESTFASMGIRFVNEKKTLKVEGLATYVTALADIKDSTKAEADGKQVVQDWLNDNWSLAVHNSYFGSYKDQSIGEDLALYKMVLTTPKSTSSYDKNDLWLIYSVTVSDNKITTPTTCYIALRYDNAAVYADGSLCLEDSSYRYGGYTDYNNLYSSLIESYNLNIEVSE